MDGSLLLPGEPLANLSAGMTLRIMVAGGGGAPSELRWGPLSLRYDASTGATVVANAGSGSSAAFLRGAPPGADGEYTTAVFAPDGTRLYVGRAPWAATAIVTSAAEGGGALYSAPNRALLPAGATLVDLQVYSWPWSAAAVANPAGC